MDEQIYIEKEISTIIFIEVFSFSYENQILGKKKNSNFREKRDIKKRFIRIDISVHKVVMLKPRGRIPSYN